MFRKSIKTMEKRITQAQQGFTIIEMIATIVVSAILSVGIITFIRDATTGLQTTTNRNQLVSAGRMAIDRLSMELHNALPNSIRASTATGSGDQCLEFIPVQATTTYINPPFGGGGGTSFQVVDFVPNLEGQTSGYAVIYPRNQDDFYDGDNGAFGSWPDFLFRSPIEEITSITAHATSELSTITLDASHRFSRRSPRQRLYVVNDPISFCVVGDKLYRYTDYGFYQTQVVDEDGENGCSLAGGDRCLPSYTSAGDKRLVTDSIDNTSLSAFSVTSQTLNRNSLLSLDFNFTSEGDAVRLNHQILSRNTP